MAQKKLFPNVEKIQLPGINIIVIQLPAKLARS